MGRNRGGIEVKEIFIILSIISFIVLHAIFIIGCISLNGKPLEGIKYFNGYAVLWFIVIYQLISFGFYCTLLSK